MHVPEQLCSIYPLAQHSHANLEGGSEYHRIVPFLHTHISKAIACEYTTSVRSRSEPTYAPTYTLPLKIWFH